MSKVEELRVKYKKTSPKDFEFFNESDDTSTKKYLEYSLRVWERRALSSPMPTKKKLVEYIKLFDELLPYINNKDIYDSHYLSFNNLISEVEKARDHKEEKTFKREDHIIVINETERYLMLSPKTYRGSLKYGSGTKWCTASKYNSDHFTSYKKGYLVYLIDKTGKKTKNYSKVALYADSSFSINGSYSVYSSTDSSIRISAMSSYGWTYDEINEIDLYFRQFIKYLIELRRAKQEVDKVINFMQNINFDDFHKNLEKLKIQDIISILDVSSTVKTFNEKISTYVMSDLL